MDGISFSVEPGEIFGILGPNGAGKTTTVELIAGLRTPDSGRVHVAGVDPRTDWAELRRRVGVQLQAAQMPDRLEVGEALELYATFYRSPADPATLLEALGLASRRRTRFKDLSGGQQQRLSVALALIGRPRIAVLDELTTGLDPRCAARHLGARGGHPRARRDDPPRHPLHRRGRAAGGPRRGARRRAACAGEQVALTGRGEVLSAVTAALARNGIVAERLRVEQTSLEDAFVALTREAA